MLPTPYIKKYCILIDCWMFGPWRSFFIFYGVPEAREVSRNLPGARGFVVIEYEPVPSHGDPICAQNGTFMVCENVQKSVT